MVTQPSPVDDEIPDEVDFARGTRGKFFQPGSAIHLPVSLDAEVQAYLSARAKAKGIEVTELVNDLLRKDIELIEAVR